MNGNKENNFKTNEEIAATFRQDIMFTSFKSEAADRKAIDSHCRATMTTVGKIMQELTAMDSRMAKRQKTPPDALSKLRDYKKGLRVAMQILAEAPKHVFDVDKVIMESIAESPLFLGGSTGALAWRWWFARLDLDSRLGKWKDASESISKIVRFHDVTSQVGC